MKKLFRILICAVLAFTLSACSNDTLDLSLLQIQYTQVLAVHVSGGEFGEGDYLNNGKIEKFVTNMNVIKTLYPVEESEVDTDNALKIDIQARAFTKTIYLLPPYINVDKRWFRASDDDVPFLENMVTLLRENLGN
ncbi:MAG: hypothetical protein IKG53_01240 [Solobacterium sp.]|nr:hypothetical protein [Solobacterium sp.]MBR3363484.1 hypothetical protein [Solobacterium sp.]